MADSDGTEVKCLTDTVRTGGFSGMDGKRNIQTPGHIKEIPKILCRVQSFGTGQIDGKAVPGGQQKGVQVFHAVFRSTHTAENQRGRQGRI